MIQDPEDFEKAILRLPIQWISSNIKDEEKLELREKEFSEFIVNLANGYKNMFGDISFNRLMSCIEKHIGAHQNSANKFNRSILKSSRRIYF